MFTISEAPSIRTPSRVAGYLFAAAGLAVLVAAYPLHVLAVAIAYTVLAATAFLLGRPWRLELWQTLVLVALTGYIVLNYGFANLVFRLGGFPIIIGHLLVFAALTVAVISNPARLFLAMREPAMLCLLALLLLSSIHLALDIPRYGLYAVRDSSVFLEGSFLLLGLAWAKKDTDLVALMKFLFAMFLVNLVYSFSFPWAEELTAWSPESGIFLVVPVFGSYAHNYLYLLAGALFCLWVARHVVRAPRWAFLMLAAAQLFGLAIHQARSMYVGILIVLLALLLLAELRKCAQLVAALSMGVGVIVLVTSLTGAKLPGRVGPVTVQFLEEHAQSLALQPGTPALGTVYDRWQWHGEVWERARSSTTHLLFGEGFGKPLIHFRGSGGVAVRQPHNTHLTVLARLGLAGIFFWALFHFSIVSRFVPALLRRHNMDSRMSALVLWLFCFYILSVIVTTVQPHLEFSYGAIPFYFTMGLALAIVRWSPRTNLDADNRREAPGHT